MHTRCYNFQLLAILDLRIGWTIIYVNLPYVSRFEKRGHLAQISIERYDPKLLTNHNLVYFLITVLAQTTILYLPPGTRTMPARVAVPPCEESTFIHSIRHSLHEWEA